MYSKCDQRTVVCCVQQMCSEGCNMLCKADVLSRLQYNVYSRCVEKAVTRCVRQICSEVCCPLCSADVYRRLPYPAYWSLTSMVVLLIRGSLLWQTSFIVVLLTHSRSRLCGSAVCCTRDRPYVPASLRHLDTPLWDELLFSCFSYAWKVLSSTC